jgi:hypothetical protein
MTRRQRSPATSDDRRPSALGVKRLRCCEGIENVSMPQWFPVSHPSVVVAARDRFARHRHSCDHVLAAREKGKRWRCRERHRGNFPASREKRDDASPREVDARPPSNFRYCGIVGQPRVIGACDMTGTAGIRIGSG